MNLKTKISKRIREFLRRALTVEPVNQKINIGLLTSHAMSARKHSMKDLWDAEFRVFSQFGEDGIVDLLLDELQISKPRIMEIGAGDFSECNSRFALHKRNCSAYLVDMREDLQRGLQESEIRWKASVAVEIAKIDEKNIQKHNNINVKKSWCLMVKTIELNKFIKTVNVRINVVIPKPPSSDPNRVRFPKGAKKTYIITNFKEKNLPRFLKYEPLNRGDLDKLLLSINSLCRI